MNICDQIIQDIVEAYNAFIKDDTVRHSQISRKSPNGTIEYLFVLRRVPQPVGFGDSMQLSDEAKVKLQ